MYSISRKCDKHYVDETSRPLGVRITEHKYYINNLRNQKESCYKKIKKKGSNVIKRKLKESATISLNGGNYLSNYLIS